eukprot:XP_011664557.1 PREDICTED: leucine-rich repeat-containing protein 15-like [Strongylocentrotus purpuratus]
MEITSSSTYVVFLFILSLSVTNASWYGPDYWNQRYGDYGIEYETGNDRFNGIWSATSAITGGGYGRANSDYSGKTNTGCTIDENELTIDCSSATTVFVKNYNFENLTSSTFFEDVTEITILGGTLQRVAADTFHNLTKLTSLDVTRNSINFDVYTYSTLTFPASLKQVSVMENSIDWVPPGLFSGTNIEYLGLSMNEITSFPSDSLKSMSNLTFLSLDDNLITSVSKRNLAVFKDSLIHLNLSNNAITYLAPRALTQLTQLKIIELHQNSLSSIQPKMFDDMTYLLHIDLNNNELASLGSNSFTNLLSLRTLFISDNRLANFPHAALSREVYESLLYLQHRNVVAKLVHQAHHDYVNNIIGNSLQGNPKTFWSYVKQCRTENMEIPSLRSDKGIHMTNKDKGECLNSFFHSVFTNQQLFGGPICKNMKIFLQYMSVRESQSADR